MTAKDIIEARAKLRSEINNLRLADGIDPIAKELVSWLYQVVWKVTLTGNEARFKPNKLKDLVELHGEQRVKQWLPTIDGFRLYVDNKTMELVLCTEE